MNSDPLKKAVEDARNTGNNNTATHTSYESV